MVSSSEPGTCLASSNKYNCVHVSSSQTSSASASSSESVSFAEYIHRTQQWSTSIHILQRFVVQGQTLNNISTFERHALRQVTLYALKLIVTSSKLTRTQNADPAAFLPGSSAALSIQARRRLVREAGAAAELLSPSLMKTAEKSGVQKKERRQLKLSRPNTVRRIKHSCHAGVRVGQ